jgi:glutathione-specific gamma-glutamylcyclotransferase
MEGGRGASLVSNGDLWVFAYGSLLWDPGFAPTEALRARLDGWHRSFCMWSFHFRGTEETPGLVLALDADPQRACEGLALRVAPGEEAEVLASLRARELISDAYEERVLPVALADGRTVEAVAYVIRRDHRQYACVDAETQARTIAAARGLRGPNVDYLANTAAHLAELGIRDPDLEALLERVRERLS